MKSNAFKCSFLSVSGSQLFVSVGGNSVTGIWWLEVRDAAKQRAMHRPASHTKNYPISTPKYQVCAKRENFNFIQGFFKYNIFLAGENNCSYIAQVLHRCFFSLLTVLGNIILYRN